MSEAATGAGATAGPGTAATPAPDSEAQDWDGSGPVRRSVLPGGLRVVTEKVAGVRSASVGVWLGVGSRDETAGAGDVSSAGVSLAGAAHFLEHLLFKGTARRSARQIAEELDAVGGELNAFTGKEHTCFYAHVLDVDLPLAVDVLCDVVLDAVMDPADVELERDVVLSEIAGRDEDPEDLLVDEFDAALLDDHPLGRPVIGSEESVTGLTRAALRGFHAEHYVPERAVVSVAGNVDHDAVLGGVRSGFGRRLSGSPVPAQRLPTSWQAGGRHRLVVREEDTEQAHLMLGVPGLARTDPRREALLVLNTALGGGMSSRLFQQVRERRGLAYSVYSSVTGYTDAGSLSVYVGCSPERLGAVSALLGEELTRVARDGLEAAEVTRAQGQLRGELVLGLEDTASRMSRLGRRELDHGSQQSISEALARIEAVTPSQVAETARELLAVPITGAVVGPYAGADDLPDELHEVIK